MSVLVERPLPQRRALAAPDGGPDRRRGWKKPNRNQLIVSAIALLAAALYTWGLSRNGMGNSYYAAAVRSGATSWKAFFFGSIDPGSFITVDKPPAALWVMSLSARVFGFSSWSMLLPEAAAGVGSVLILHRLVRKWAGDLSAHLAALALAVTPVAVLMFRLQQSRRPPHPAVPGGGLGAVVGAGDGPDPGPAAVPPRCSAWPSTPRCCRPSWSLPAIALVYLCAGPPQAAPSGSLQLAAAGRRPARRRRLVGCRSSPCGRRRRGPTSAAPPTTRSSA